jgi:hypothetical protein
MVLLFCDGSASGSNSLPTIFASHIANSGVAGRNHKAAGGEARLSPQIGCSSDDILDVCPAVIMTLLVWLLRLSVIINVTRTIDNRLTPSRISLVTYYYEKVGCFF